MILATRRHTAIPRWHCSPIAYPRHLHVWNRCRHSPRTSTTPMYRKTCQSHGWSGSMTGGFGREIQWWFWVRISCRPYKMAPPRSLLASGHWRQRAKSSIGQVVCGTTTTWSLSSYRRFNGHRSRSCFCFGRVFTPSRSIEGRRGLGLDHST